MSVFPQLGGSKKEQQQSPFDDEARRKEVTEAVFREWGMLKGRYSPKAQVLFEWFGRLAPPAAWRLTAIAAIAPRQFNEMADLLIRDDEVKLAAIEDAVSAEEALRDTQRGITDYHLGVKS